MGTRFKGTCPFPLTVYPEGRVSAEGVYVVLRRRFEMRTYNLDFFFKGMIRGHIAASLSSISARKHISLKLPVWQRRLTMVEFIVCTLA
jgi:hypothetical protein